MENFNTVQLLNEATDFVSRSFGVTNNALALNQLVSQNEQAYESFVGKLAEGMNLVEEQDFKQYAANSAAVRLEQSLFSENSSSNMSKFAILDTMMLREIWNRLGARDVMTYKVLETPLVYIPFLKQYMKGPNGELVDIPTALSASSFTGKVFDAKVRFVKHDKSAFINYASFNAFANFVTGGAEVRETANDNFVTATPIPNPHGKMTLDSFGEIYKVIVNEDASGNFGNANSKDQELPVSFKCDTEGNFYAEINFFDKDHAQGQTGATAYSDTIMGKVNRLTGDVTLSVLKGHVRAVFFKSKISQETNRGTFDMVQKMEREIVAIGDGDTINSSISVQYLQDTKAILKIDAIAEISKLLSQTFATIYDMQVYSTVADSVTSESQKSEFNASMIYNNAHIGISRQMHNSNLLDKLIKSVGIIDNTYNFNSETDFYVLCNPIENSIISSAIAPDYAGTVSKGGSVKPYTSGQFVQSVGKNDIRIISSKSYEAGKMFVVPKPSDSSEIVFGYYDYSQVLMPLGAYRSEYNELVPTIMMNKRKTIKSFRPESTHCINVKNSTKDV